MPTALNYTHLTSSFTDVNILGYNWIIPTMILALTLVLITRDINKWKSLALPVTALLHIIGLRIHVLLFFIIGIIFIIDTISIQLLGNTIEGVSNLIKERKERTKETTLTKLPTIVRGKLLRKEDIIKREDTELDYEGIKPYPEQSKQPREMHEPSEKLDWWNFLGHQKGMRRKKWQ